MTDFWGFGASSNTCALQARISSAILLTSTTFGVLAHSVERRICNSKASGAKPEYSTNFLFMFLFVSDLNYKSKIFISL